MMSAEAHIEDGAALQEESEEEGVVIDVYGWLNLHKLSMCLAAVYVVYYLLVIVRVRLLFSLLSHFYSGKLYVIKLVWTH